MNNIFKATEGENTCLAHENQYRISSHLFEPKLIYRILFINGFQFISKLNPNPGHGLSPKSSPNMAFLSVHHILLLYHHGFPHFIYRSDQILFRNGYLQAIAAQPTSMGLLIRCGSGRVATGHLVSILHMLFSRSGKSFWPNERLSNVYSNGCCVWWDDPEYYFIDAV